MNAVVFMSYQVKVLEVAVFATGFACVVSLP